MSHMFMSMHMARERSVEVGQGVVVSAHVFGILHIKLCTSKVTEIR